jgi:hypothetical protein
VALDKSPEPCPHCDGEGVLRWSQPTPGPDGGVLMREMETPCPNGCGGDWKHPAAEADRVVDTPSDAPERVRGHADAANEIGGDFIKRFIADQR